MSQEHENYGFPFQPYEIQRDFMNNLREVLDEGKIGIFESPTGTGKSLSLICGSASWLLEQKSKDPQSQEKESSESDPSVPAWIREASKREKDLEKERKEREEEKRKKRAERVERHEKKWSSKKAKALLSKPEDEFLIGNECEADGSGSGAQPADSSGKSLPPPPPSVGALDGLFSSDSGSGSESEDGDNNAEFTTPKILFCSRTHTQLSQFISELRRTVWASKVRVISLGSRKTMCINDGLVAAHGHSLARLNEACMDLQRSKKRTKKGKKCGCPYFDSSAQKTFRDHAMARLHDIETLVSLGRALVACPYYGTRRGVPDADIVVMPYPCVLHKDTRESLGIKSLKGCVVIFDEAHNIVDAVNEIHSCHIDGESVSAAHHQLSQYMARYRTRLLSSNMAMLKRLATLLNAFHKFFLKAGKEEKESPQKATKEKEVQTINDFTFALGIDHINMFELETFIKKTELVKKLQGFTQKERETAEEVTVHSPPAHPSLPTKGKDKQSPASTPKKLDEKGGGGSGESGGGGGVSARYSALQDFVSFLVCLNNYDVDGRIIVNRCSERPLQSSVKFMLLNPAIYFRDIIDEAKAVVFAGGTMQPMSEFRQQLLGHVPPARLHAFSCGHVIPDSNLLPLVVSSGPTGHPFEFTFANRETHEMIDELGRAVANVCAAVPDGIVCFFPSYAYESTVVNRWTETGVIARMEKKKKFLREPRGGSDTSIEQVLRDYKTYIDANFAESADEPSRGLTGAFLSCVVGGKVSEGINFSDGYGRCVIVVGMPYPNPHDAEIREKMAYLDAKAKTAAPPTTPQVIGGEKSKEGGEGAVVSPALQELLSSGSGRPGQVYYENLCMKAVNQSIGRSIRHANDYATILLVDKRYERPSVRDKLPGWIKGRLKTHADFGGVFGDVSKFFREKRGQQETFEKQRREKAKKV